MHDARHGTAPIPPTSVDLAPLNAVRRVLAILVQPPGTDGFTAFLALHRVLRTVAPTILAHGERTAAYALQLAAAVSLPWPDRVALLYASVMHDLGTLVLSRAVREKPGPLTAGEYVQMQCHPRAGVDLLWPVRSLRETGLIIAHHHERWDGGGYPYGIGGELIPLPARILAVADTFDALRSADNGETRDHAVALGVLQAVAGRQLDPALVASFVTVVSNETASASALERVA